MEIPQVLALPLDEAARRLEAAGCSYEVPASAAAACKRGQT